MLVDASCYACARFRKGPTRYHRVSDFPKPSNVNLDFFLLVFTFHFIHDFSQELVNFKSFNLSMEQLFEQSYFALGCTYTYEQLNCH